MAAVGNRSRRAYHLLRTRAAPAYPEPTGADLAIIERSLAGLGVRCRDLELDPREFATFIADLRFPADYHGGPSGGVYREKLLEHFVAWKLVGLDSGKPMRYVDIAAASSPWARMLRSRGIEAYAIDLAVPAAYAQLDYYRKENAVRTSFAAASVQGASLQCAFEMFLGSDDIALVGELGRILAPSARAVIAPLYMHTHPCHYQSPEFFGRPAGDPESTAYVRRNTWGIPASRKYSAATLHSRVLDHAAAAGLDAFLYALRDKERFGSGIYMHFVLVLEKHRPDRDKRRQETR